MESWKREEKEVDVRSRARRKEWRKQRSSWRWPMGPFLTTFPIFIIYSGFEKPLCFPTEFMWGKQFPLIPNIHFRFPGILEGQCSTCSFYLKSASFASFVQQHIRATLKICIRHTENLRINWNSLKKYKKAQGKTTTLFPQNVNFFHNIATIWKGSRKFVKIWSIFNKILRIWRPAVEDGTPTALPQTSAARSEFEMWWKCKPPRLAGFLAQLGNVL